MEPVVTRHPDIDPIAALLELASTSPRLVGIEGLNYVTQLDRVAVRSGLSVPSAPSLEEIAAFRGADRSRAERPADAAECCPLPGLSDLGPVAQLRETLCAALFDEEGSPNCGPAVYIAGERLTRAALEYGLLPALTRDGRLTVDSARADVAGRLASRLVPAAMSLVADGLMPRLRTCSDVWCRAPFLDRTRNGCAQFCSRTCAARVRKRRQRAA
ncbi:MAG: CGNR zinc finger domain-containing protein [Sinomonas sp.]|nr:CGNR zinc finger domain-containing protein [Sinomonas sp.]